MQSVEIISHTFKNSINESWKTHYMNFILFMLNVKNKTTVRHSSITTDLNSQLNISEAIPLRRLDNENVIFLVMSLAVCLLANNADINVCLRTRMTKPHCKTWWHYNILKCHAWFLSSFLKIF